MMKADTLKLREQLPKLTSVIAAWFRCVSPIDDDMQIGEAYVAYATPGRI